MDAAGGPLTIVDEFLGEGERLHEESTITPETNVTTTSLSDAVIADVNSTTDDSSDALRLTPNNDDVAVGENNESSVENPNTGESHSTVHVTADSITINDQKEEDRLPDTEVGVTSIAESTAVNIFDPELDDHLHSPESDAFKEMDDERDTRNLLRPTADEDDTLQHSSTEFDGEIKILLPTNISPTRGTFSRVSSMASRSSVNCFDAPTTPDNNGLNLENDIDEVDGIASEMAMDSIRLGSGELVALLGGTTDEKSVRSESTRPDPPSILDGQNPRGLDYSGDDSRVFTETVIEYVTTDNNASSIDVENDLAAVSTESNFGDTVEPPDPDERLHPISSDSWDLDRQALLASTPRTEPKMLSPAVLLQNESLPVPPTLSNGTTSSSTLNVPATTTAPSNIESDADVDDTVVVPRQFNPNQLTGPDNLVVLPRVDEHRFYTGPLPLATTTTSAMTIIHSNAPHASSMPQTAPLPLHQPQQLSSMSTVQMSPIPPAYVVSQSQTQHGSFSYVQQQSAPTMMTNGTTTGGRRKIRLRLQEEVRNSNSTIKRHFRSNSLLGTLRKSSKRMLRFGGSYTSASSSSLSDDAPELYKTVDRGSLSVSWYEGTSSLELQQHVRKSVTRKLKLENSSVELDDFRILDDAVDPPEEIVLAPYVPDGAQFLLRFTTTNSSVKEKIKETDGTMTPLSQYSGRAPVSPSAAPSPHPDKDLFSTLNVHQLALLNSLNISAESLTASKKKKSDTGSGLSPDANEERNLAHPLLRQNLDNRMESLRRSDSVEEDDVLDNLNPPDQEENGTSLPHSDDPIESRLREITELLLLDRKRSRHFSQERSGEKRQVIFIVANYFVLFLALIAISAELQARAPHWLKQMEVHLQSVQNCSENQEALFECVSRGDFAGLIASVLLWLSRSVATKRIFLFGFDTPKKLWTVVYESAVTAICWGISYLFIRRGMNSDTRPRFVQKYWKDAVYGSLAGFNAAFLKQVLKNLIPEEVVEGALRERQLKILGWLPSFA